MISPAKRGGTTNIDKVLIMFLEVMSDDHELGKRFEKAAAVVARRVAEAPG